MSALGAALALVLRSAVLQSEPPPLFSETLQLTLGAGVVSRQVTINDDLFGRFSNYNLALAPELAAAVDWFPFAERQSGWWSGLGIFARGDYTFTPQTQQESARLRTTMLEAAAGVAFRHTFGRLTPRLQIGFEYSGLDFAGASAAPMPLSLHNGLVEPSLGLGAVFLPWLSLSVEASYLAVVASTGLGSDFPRATSVGVEASLMLSFALPRAFFVALAGQYRRISYDFHVRPGDDFIAGGAVDQSMLGEVTTGWRW
jgi:hypothetical protein